MNAIKRFLQRRRERWDKKTQGLQESLETLQWALKWMQREYPEDFRRCMKIIIGSAIFSGASPILSDQLLGAVIPNYQAGQSVCLLDLILFSCILIVGQMMFVYEFLYSALLIF